MALQHNGEKRRGKTYYGTLMCIEFWPSNLIPDAIYWRRTLGATGIQVPDLVSRAEWEAFVADLDQRYQREVMLLHRGQSHTITQLIYRSETGFRLYADRFRAYQGGEL